MSESVDSWPDERVQTELKAVLAELQTLEDHLAEPLTLSSAITKLETTRAMYEHAVVGV
ncbi:hypothetical protein HYG81_20060 (plasmid) [Natrinema zhouii]|uniref:hypothetical protein n=1 Tax=Natrinema zhouii TaxID=1710539 RepID=UPI001D000DC7|nr:hypothetical protein [Natrinema zhouii]UHQ98358.1 hypothetical protein HYG81_20060 [Natrinema zhouii]